MINEFDTESLSDILSGYGDWFTAHLFRLIARSDSENRKRLFRAFPEEVDIVNVFQWGKQEAENFKINATSK